MGISVPVSSKHYKDLKIISDRLDVGIKRTLEYLITYYLKAEISHPNTVEIKPVKSQERTENNPKEDDSQPILVNLEPVFRYEIPSEIPSNLASRINPYFIEPKDTVSTYIPGFGRNLPILGHQTPESSLNRVEDIQNCNACGVPRRKSARYCYNCGNQVR